MPSIKTSFTAVIYSIARNRCVDLPPEVSELFGSAGNKSVRLTFGSETSTSLVPRKQDGHRVFVSKDLRAQAGVGIRDEIKLQIEPDPSGGEPDFPPDVITRLGKTPGALEALLSRPPADRRQAFRWLEAARTQATRDRRVETLIERLLTPPRRKS